MTGGTAPGAASGPETGGSAEDSDLLERVRNTAMLLAGLSRSPGRLRVRAGAITVELEWATPEPAPSGLQPAAGVLTAESPAGADVTTSRRAPAIPRITAPTVGTFYRRPEPGAAAYVELGDQVKPGQQVAIVEVMKLMLPVEADTAGVIAKVLAEDGQPVEYGQALFVLDPGPEHV